MFPAFIKARYKSMEEKGKKFPSIYHVFLRFLLVISKHSRLENKIPHMDVRPSDLSPTVSRHPSLVHHLGHLSSRKKKINLQRKLISIRG